MEWNGVIAGLFSSRLCERLLGVGVYCIRLSRAHRERMQYTPTLPRPGEPLGLSALQSRETNSHGLGVRVSP